MWGKAAEGRERWAEVDQFEIRQLDAMASSRSLSFSLQPFDAYRYETIVRSRRARISFLASALHRIGDRGVGSSVAIAACVVARGGRGREGARGRVSPES